MDVPDANSVADLMSDDEIARLGFEPTLNGWKPMEQALQDRLTLDEFFRKLGA